MPSYALNQFIDLDDVMCKLLNLDLREPPKMSALPVSPVGHKKLRVPCSFSSSSSCLSDPKVNAAGTGGHWGQPSLGSSSSISSSGVGVGGGDMALQSSWNKMAFWAERSVSMVENSSSSLGWASSSSTTEPSGCKPVSASSCTSLPSLPLAASLAASCSGSPAAATTSSRYKTELCRTYAERGICKYGSKCQFAHGAEELRDINRHPKYKTEPCRTFHSVGFCPYGIRCHFVHNNEDDLGPPGPRPKSSLTTPPPSSSSCSSSSSLSPPGRVLPPRPPLLKQSFSFAGFPSNPPPPPLLDASLPHAFLRAPSVSPPASAADLSELLSLAFPDVDTTSASFVAAAAAATAAALELEAGRGDQLHHHHLLNHHQQQQHLPIPQHQQQPPQFLPSPDSGCSTCSLNSCSSSHSSTTSSPALPSPPHTCLPEPLSAAAAAAAERCLQRSPPGVGAVTMPGAFTAASSIPIAAAASAMGPRSLSHTSLSDQEGGCGSSASSLSGSDSGASGFEGVGGRRLPIFSQLSVPDDAFCGEGSSAGSGGGVGFFL
ncbi:mRNA decay activator protein ZFP36L2 [Engraulis encrasicolus]|uniref:mRNA decay activator protein ZFP36L2 n=1 Tax=Engraulis encrasicolus TaxID=184585 RepID=UPI002FCECEF4